MHHLQDRKKYIIKAMVGEGSCVGLLPNLDGVLLHSGCALGSATGEPLLKLALPTSVSLSLANSE